MLDASNPGGMQEGKVICWPEKEVILRHKSIHCLPKVDPWGTPYYNRHKETNVCVKPKVDP